MSESYVKPTLWEYVLILHPRDRITKRILYKKDKQAGRVQPCLGQLPIGD